MQKKTFSICTIEAPCKINLHLGIGKKRPDGFHSLSSLFAPLAFSDTIKFEIIDKEDDCCLLEGNNLILKAVSLFRKQTSFKSALNISLEKRIPIGAGLGGGSSDAASTLLALNLLAGGATEGLLPMKELMEMAALLGSDVPFFISFFYNSLTGRGSAFVSGRGEFVEPVKTPQGLWVILVMPPFSSDTASAFRSLDRMRALSTTHGEVSRMPLSREALIRHLEEESGTWPFYNDFLPVFLFSNEADAEKAAAYRSILESLQAFGASFAGLSGAGSCCFGIFNDKKTAEIALKGLSRGGNFVRLTFFLAHKANSVLE